MPQGKYIKVRNSSEKGVKEILFSNNNWQWTIISLSKDETVNLVKELVEAVKDWDKNKEGIVQNDD